MKNQKTVLAVAAVAFGLSTASSQASMVINNAGSQSTALGGLTSIASSSASYGASLGSLDLAGTLMSSVYTGNNSLTEGGDTFVYTLSESSSANDVVDGLSLTGFAGTTFAVYYVTPSGAQVSAAGSYTLSGPLQVITILFNQNLTAGQSYSQVVVYDSAHNYAPNGAAVIDTLSANSADLAPAPVPEPSTVIAGALMLLPLGIGAVRGLCKWRAA